VSPPEATSKAAARYIEAGWAPIPVPAGEKNPKRRGWQNERVGLEDVPKHWTNGQNIGVLLGPPSGGLLDVDLDVRELLRIADRFLPPTLTSGRPGAERSHRWYQTAGSIRRESFRDIGGELVLEIRGDGHQTIVPPSVHPSGERCAWSDAPPTEPVEVDVGELLRVCRELATAGIIARHLPGKGRHDLALALAGFLLRRGLDIDATARVMHAGWAAAGSDEQRHREAHRDIDGIVRDTAAKLAEGAEARGGRALDGIVPGLALTISKHWDWPKDAPSPVEPVGSRNGHRQESPGFNRTDQGNAERLVNRHGSDLLHVEAWGRWLVWDGTRWQFDDTNEVFRRAKETVKTMYHEADPGNGAPIDGELSKHALRSESAPRIRDMISLAKSEPGIAARTSDFDRDLWPLNCENGTLDLRTGKLREHRREDRITKTAGTRYESDADAPTWEAFLERVLPSVSLRGFVQRLCGYALTGDVSEQILPFLYGTGANGKSTLVNTVLAVMGDYGQQAAPDLLLAKKGSHPTELADLFGARFVASVEVEDGRRMAEGLVKQLTGGERIRARYMRQDFWEFDPTHKVFLVANHKPEVRGTDHAIWRRIKMVPFDVTIPNSEKDERLPEKLRDEMPGILAWMVRGCLDWQAEGLGEPDEVRAATEGYRAEMDVLASFIGDRCVVHERASVLATPLYEAYRGWCEENGEQPAKQTKFGRSLRERGFEKALESGTRRKMWRGIGLHDPRTAPTTGLLSDVAGV
jgi:P4 family phage/plasmid primase-like protien